MSDFYWKQGDTTPIRAQLTASGTPIDLTGATVKFVMRAVDSTVAAVNASASIDAASTGRVSYTPIGADTATPGDYEAEWQITFSTGAKQTVPDPGFTTITIFSDLAVPGGTLPVTLSYVKQFLNWQNSSSNDEKLVKFIATATQLIEDLIGPISPITVVETYDGGTMQIALRTGPVLSVTSVVETVGGQSVAGGVYQLDGDYMLTKITAPAGVYAPFGFDLGPGVGYGWLPFYPGRRNVTVTYQAGRATVSDKLKMAIAEQVRHLWDKSQQGSRSRGQMEDAPSPTIPDQVVELLGAEMRPPVVG